MPHNPSRYTIKALEESDQAAVDAYKARSVWRAWWKLGEHDRRRYFTDEQRRFIRRHGERLDGLASLVTAPRTEAEKHFVQVCNGELQPTSDRERLWLLVQIVCRYQDASERAARVSLAEHRAETLEAEISGLRMVVHENDDFMMQLIAENRMLNGGEEPVRGPVSIGNVDHATLRFRKREGYAPMPLVITDPRQRRWEPLRMRSSKSAIEQPSA